MGRAKKYEREVVTATAMELFWRGGFNATSTTALCEAMGLNRFSLYAEFGSKQGLFACVMDRYIAEVLPVSMGRMMEPNADLSAVREVLLRFAGRAGSERGRKGCMMCNVALELGATDPFVDRAFRRYTDLITAAFANALQGAARAGQLRQGLEPADESRLCTATALGMFALLKGGGDPVTLDVTARALLSRLTEDSLGM
jgi:TetR/AcrR family transcriptional repressor of nem operon